MSEENFKNPRKLLNAWEAQALATLTSKGLPNSFKAITELMRDESQDAEAITAAEILFWGRVWRQSKTKEEVVTSWNHNGRSQVCLVFSEPRATKRRGRSRAMIEVTRRTQ